MDMTEITIEQFNELMPRKPDAKGVVPPTKIEDIPTTLVMQHVNMVPVRYKRVGDKVQVVTADGKKAFGDTFGAAPAPAPVATGLKGGADEQKAKVEAGKAVTTKPKDQAAELDAEQKAYMDAATPVVPKVDVTPVKDAAKGVVAPPVQRASPAPAKPAAAAPQPAPKPAPAATPTPVAGRRYQDPVQAALWQARTDALQRYYADKNWGSLGADQLGGVMGSYVNASTHKRNGQELAYDAKTGEWVDVTPIDMGDDKAWRAFSGKDRHDAAKRWDWAWEQAHPAAPAPVRAEDMTDDAAWAKVQEDYAATQAKAAKEREDALARQKANTLLIAQAVKDDRDMFGPGRTWFGGEPGSSSLKDVIGSLGRPRVTSDRRTKRIIKAISRRF